MTAQQHPTSLSSSDASIAKGMLARGDRQHDIAAWFGVNAGRVADVATGKKHRDVPAAPEHSLPPAGPYSYFTERPDMSLADQLRQVLAALDLKWSRSLAEVAEERRTARHEARQTNEKIDRLERQLFDLRRLSGAVEEPKTPRASRRKPLAS